MAMSRKHYQAFADILRDEMEYAETEDIRTAIRTVTNRLATVFADDNPRFDRAKFIRVATDY